MQQSFNGPVGTEQELFEHGAVLLSFHQLPPQHGNNLRFIAVLLYHHYTAVHCVCIYMNVGTTLYVNQTQLEPMVDQA